MKNSKYTALDWVLLIVKFILLPIFIFWAIWKIFKKDDFNETDDRILEPQEIVSVAKAIADDLGTGHNWTADEYDEDAAIKISKLNKVNWEGVKFAYKSLYQSDLVDDANRLIDSDIKLKYKSFLFPKGIL